MADGALVATLPIFELSGVAGCLVFSAFFSGSETALTSLPRARVQQLLEANDGRGSLKLLLNDPVRVLTTILIGNNIVNVTASALATGAAEKMLTGTSIPFVNPVAVAVGVMTLLLLTFGEITPKSLARANAERVAPICMTLLLPFDLMLSPFTKAFVWLSRQVSKVTGSPLDDGPSVSEDELEFLIELGRREGSLTGDREALLRAVFDFTETTVREVMVPRTDTVMVPSNIAEADLHKLFLRAGHSRLPVFGRDQDDIIGLVYAKDLLRFLAERQPNQPFRMRRLLRRADFVPVSKPIAELLRDMQARRVHMAVAVDEFGGIAGIVTLEDIMEELLGEIRDEYDVESDAIELVAPGDWRIEARINLDDLWEELDVEADEIDDIDTLGGFLSQELGEVGQPGAVVEAWGFRFTVEEADPRRVLKVRAERLSPPNEATDDMA